MENHTILIDDIEYKVTYDKYTGDWSVYSEQDPLVQGDWFLTKEGAINYILDRRNVINNDNYDRAPDRC
jgi:hypothetical protein